MREGRGGCHVGTGRKMYLGKDLKNVDIRGKNIPARTHSESWRKQFAGISGGEGGTVLEGRE